MARRRHTPDQIIRKLAEGNKLLAGGTELDAVCRHLEIAESTWHRWVAQFGGMKADDAKRPHRVARMRRDGLVGAHARKKWRRGNDKMVPAPDLLQRDFTAARPDLRWVADISEFHCIDGKLYLAGIRDLCDHTLVGWSMGERQTTDLVVAALVMATDR
jgi:transposase InsO family protein